MSKMFFPRGLKVGDPVSRAGLVAGILKMADALENMSVHNGRVDWSGGKPKIVLKNTTSRPASSFSQVPDIQLTFDPDGGSWTPNTALTIRVNSSVSQLVVQYCCVGWDATNEYWVVLKPFTEGTTPVEASFITPGAPYTKWVIQARYKTSDTSWTSYVQSKDFAVI